MYYFNKFLKFKDKINFDVKLYFFCFMVSNQFERGVRKTLESSVRERKILVALIPITKTVDIDVKLFYLMRRVHVKCFFFFFYVRIAYKNISEL